MTGRLTRSRALYKLHCSRNQNNVVFVLLPVASLRRPGGRHRSRTTAARRHHDQLRSQLNVACAKAQQHVPRKCSGEFHSVISDTRTNMFPGKFAISVQALMCVRAPVQVCAPGLRKAVRSTPSAPPCGRRLAPEVAPSSNGARNDKQDKTHHVRDV